MNAQHTPGPWVARNWTCHAPTTIGRYVDDRFEAIADCGGFGRDREQDEADANLIASAPELLEMVSDLSKVYRAMLIADSDLLKKARAIVAKATGSVA